MADGCLWGVCLDSLNRLQPLALLVMRVVLGAIMIAHGYHKDFITTWIW
jgi:uncharacterized membrane protein YphA (DoxX/SURF4 family)